MAKRVMRRVLVFFLVLSFGIIGVGTASVEAATNKALQFSYSFNGQTYEKNGDDCGYNNCYSVWVAGTSKKYAIKNLRMRVDIYIPKTALKKKGSAINASPYLDLLDTKGEYVAWAGGRISISAVNENGKIKLYAWDEVKQKNVKASTYATCKAGTGAYKSYYVLNLKKIPLSGTMLMTDGNESETIKSSTKNSFNLGVNVTGEGSKTSGKIYVDNIKVDSGSKTIVNETFSKTPKWYGVYNRGKDLAKSKVKIVKF